MNNRYSSGNLSDLKGVIIENETQTPKVPPSETTFGHLYSVQMYFPSFPFSIKRNDFLSECARLAIHEDIGVTNFTNRR